MGKRNYLIEGVSGTGKTTVCAELRRRGYLAINGDRQLRLQQRRSGPNREGRYHEDNSRPPRGWSPIWDVEKVRRLAENQDDDATSFCGGSRNFKEFIDLFDEIFILEVDVKTLNERLDSRPDDWGKSKIERELILRLHATKEDLPSSGIVIDATQPLVIVVDEILRQVRILKLKIQTETLPLGESPTGRDPRMGRNGPWSRGDARNVKSDDT